MEISSMYANGGFESTEKLQEAVMSIGSTYGESIASMYNVLDANESISLNQEFEIDPDDPFFRKGKLGG